MRIKTFLNTMLVTVMVLVWFVPGTLAAAFGISPPWIVNENLKPGSSFVYVIDLSTNDPAADMKVKTTVTGDQEIKDWIKVRNAGALMMPKGEQHFPMYVELTVPPNAAVGSYSGSISISVEPTDGLPENEVAILLGGHVAVNLDVVNYDVTDFWVKSIAVNPIIEGQPLQLTMMVKNLGNTPLSEVETRVELSGYKTGDYVASGSASKLVSLVYPHTIKETELNIPVGALEEGNYWVNVSALKDGKVIYQNRLYLTVNGDGLNSQLETAVTVPGEGVRAVAPSTRDDSVSLTTTVMVRAPLTNKLIGLMIVLMIVLIVITGKIYGNVNRKRKR